MDQKGQSTADQIGCLAVIVVIAMVTVWAFGRMERSEDRDMLESVTQMIQKSENADTNRYFDQVVQAWYHLGQNHNWDKSFNQHLAGDLEFTKTNGGRFALTLSHARFGQEQSGHDLGILGREVSIDYISTIVWLCGNKIGNVSSIRVTLMTTDMTAGSHLTASYVAEISPDISFAQAWKGHDDPALTALVAKRMMVISDEASGKMWVTVYRK